MKIIHLADIHIPLYERHDEYRKVFDNTLSEIQNIGPVDVIVIVGDLNDRYTQLSSDSKILTENFLSSLTSYCKKIILIDGNHDYSKQNKERISFIESIVSNLDKDKIVYVKDMLRFDFNEIPNIDWYSHSHKTGNTKWPKTSFRSRFNVALYHGVVNGASTDTGFVFDNEEYSKSYFDQFDLALLGDIHKLQYFGNRIAYPSSLIQQDFGESPDNHGFILWEIDSIKKEVKSTFHPIFNPYAKYTLRPENIHCHYNETGEWIIDKTDIDDKNITPDSTIRVITNVQLSVASKHKLQQLFSSRFKTNHIIIDSIEGVADNKTTSIIFDTNYHDINVQKKTIKQFYPTISNDELEQIYILNEEVNQRIKIKENVLRNKKVVPTKLTIENLLSFQDEQTLFFSKLPNGTIGISGRNFSGKSSLVDILLWTLYGKFSRSTSKSEILNKFTDKNGKAIFYFTIDKLEYRIKRTINRRKQSTVSFEIYQPDKTWKPLSEIADTKRDTDKVIVKYFGNYDDLIFTSISPQDSITEVISSKKIRKDIISRFLGIDIFEECYKLANKDKLAVESQIKVLSDENYETKREQMKIELNNCNKQYDSYTSEMNTIDSSIETISNEINNVKTQLGKLESINISELNKSIREKTDRKNQIMIDLDKIPSLKESLNSKYKLCDVTKDIAVLENLKKDIVSLNESITTKTNAIEIQYQNKMNDFNKRYIEIYTKEENLLLQSESNFKAWDNEMLILKSELDRIDSNVLTSEKLASLVDKSYCKGIGEYAQCEFIKSGVESQNQLVVLREEYKTKMDRFVIVVNEKNVAETEVNKYKLKIKELEGGKTKYIDELKQKKSDDVFNALSNLRKDIDEKNKQILYTQKIINDVELQKKDIESKIQKLDIMRSGLDKELNLIQSYLTENIPLFDDAINSQGKKDRLLELQTKERELISNKNSLSKQITEKIQEKSKYESLIIHFNERIEKLKGFEEIYRTYELYLKAYSDDGIPFTVMKNVIPYMELEVNKIISNITDLKVKIDTDEETKDIIVYKYVNSLDDKIVVDFCSGFEKFIISIAMRLAYLELNSLCQLDIFIIDEGIGVVDIYNRTKLDVVFNYLKTRFSKVLVISHIEDIQDFYDYMIEVKKENDRSIIV